MIKKNEGKLYFLGFVVILFLQGLLMIGEEWVINFFASAKIFSIYFIIGHIYGLFVRKSRIVKDLSNKLVFKGFILGIYTTIMYFTNTYNMVYYFALLFYLIYECARDYDRYNKYLCYLERKKTV